MTRAFARAVCLVAALACPSSAFAVEVSLQAGATAGFPATSPQRDYFGPGFGLFGGGQAALLPVLDVGLSLGYVYLGRRADSPLPNAGTALWLGPTVRGHVPFKGALLAPWVELSFAYVRTGTLDRPGLRAAAGAFLPLGPLRIGPRLEVQVIFRVSDEAAFPTRDGVFVLAGVAVELPVAGTSAAATQPADEAKDGASRAPPLDADGDGVLGAADACPDRAEDIDGFADSDGCPDLDDDGDGVPDARDDCKNVAGTVPAGGCPDSDGDEIPDRLDLCPKVKGLPADAGCPAYKEVKVTADRFELQQQVFFATGKALILKKSFAMLDEVVRAVSDRGDICLAIGGHTDAVGDLFRNMTLSDDRAAAVRTYLVQHGLDPARVSSKGYGPTMPIADNKTADGRERNRRVELLVVPCATAR